MNTADKNTAPTRAPSMIQLGRRVLLLIGISVVGVMLIWLWLTWQGTKQGQMQRMRIAVGLIAGQAGSFFSDLASDMQLLGHDLIAIDVTHNPRSAESILIRFKQRNPNLGGATVILPNGQIIASTAHKPGEPLPNVLANPEWREDFALSLSAAGLTINRPQQSYLLKKLIVPLRYTQRSAAGKPVFVLQTSILLEQQQSLWRNLPLPAEASIGLLRDDGFVISRFPESLSKEIYSRKVGGALYQATRVAPSGTYEGIVALDGLYRMGAYERLGHQPLYAFLSIPRHTALAMWWQLAQVPVYLVLAVLLSSILGYRWMAWRYASRMRTIEAELHEPTLAGRPTSSGVREIDQMVTALVDAREQLRESARNREKLLLSAVEAGTYAVRERDHTVVAADESFLRMLGRERAEVIGRSWDTLASSDESMLAGGTQDLARRVLRIALGGGEQPRWIAVAEYCAVTPQGESIRHGMAIDVTERERLLNHVNIQSHRMQALWQLAMARGKTDREKMQLMLRLALDVLQMDVVMVNEYEGGRLHLRELADDLRQYAVGQVFMLEDSLCRQAVIEQRSVIISDLRADPEHYRHPAAVTAGVRGFASVPVFSGSTLYGTMAFMRRAPLGEDFGSDERAFIELLAAWIGQIVLEQRQHHELERMAMTDTLTGLTNRRAAEARFSEEFARARRAGEGFSVAVLDLDRFKLINDHYGHDAGDQVLVHVAGIMRANLREGDWVARWGGEEFIIYLHQAEGHAAHAIMERLRLAIKGNPVTTEHGPLDITTSIGVGTFHGEGDLASVMSEADGALFEAKRAGRDHVVVSEASRRGTLWTAGMLQHALVENRIVPAYQVIVDLRTGQIVADEALARIVEPGGRVIAASDFVEAAEGINLIHIVDEVIARQSMDRCAIHVQDGGARGGYAHFINLSPQFLARRELVQAMLHRAAQLCVECGMVDVPVKPLVLEITERQLISNFGDLLNDLKPLLDFGFRLALDDFGSGYSSFLYLATLPVSFLKIEGWMVQNMRTNPRVLAMVKSIIALARDQGITTIAECVEDEETAAMLRVLGADWAQGYYFGRPECEFDLAGTGTPARPGIVIT
jgi:diguanylate cyclase (GGDEF)-like protein